MIWNSELNIRNFCGLVVIACCSGCGSIGAGVSALSSYENHVDLSDKASDEVATIRGEIRNVGIGRTECTIRSPARTKSVTVNAGIIDILVECGPYGGGSVANLQFEALAGREYLIRPRMRSLGRIQLLDVTTDEVIVEAPSCTGIDCFLDLSTSYDKALIREELEGGGKNSCQPVAEQGYLGVVSLLYVDAGPITVDVNCSSRALMPWQKKLTASFDFVAKTGHTYTFSKKDKKCMRLLDITSEEVVIACEPYK